MFLKTLMKTCCTSWWSRHSFFLHKVYCNLHTWNKVGSQYEWWINKWARLLKQLWEKCPIRRVILFFVSSRVFLCIFLFSVFNVFSSGNPTSGNSFPQAGYKLNSFKVVLFFSSSITSGWSLAPQINWAYSQVSFRMATKVKPHLCLILSHWTRIFLNSDTYGECKKSQSLFLLNYLKFLLPT